MNTIIVSDAAQAMIARYCADIAAQHADLLPADQEIIAAALAGQPQALRVFDEATALAWSTAKDGAAALQVSRIDSAIGAVMAAIGEHPAIGPLVTAAQLAWQLLPRPPHTLTKEGFQAAVVAQHAAHLRAMLAQWPDGEVRPGLVELFCWLTRQPTNANMPLIRGMLAD